MCRAGFGELYGLALQRDRREAIAARARRAARRRMLLPTRRMAAKAMMMMEVMEIRTTIQTRRETPPW